MYIAFTAFQALQDDLEWRLTYVGSANSEEFDQRLDTILVGPVTVSIFCLFIKSTTCSSYIIAKN
jgi:hypothetical protein